MLKRIFRPTQRAAQGFIDSIFTLIKLPLRCPDYSCVNRRAKSVNTPILTLRDYNVKVGEAMSMIRALNKMTRAGMPESVRIA